MAEFEFSKNLTSKKTAIDGLLIFDLPVHGDSRGWFKENWQHQKMTAKEIGLPDFGPVQNNISFNAEKGVTRGLHAEPWDKYISTGSGSVFGVWCDIRENSPTYGKVVTQIIDPSVAIYVPRGVANGFQALEDQTVYTYLVNDHWSPDAKYSNVSIFDKSLKIDWPISLDKAIISEKDHNHPDLKDATPIKPKKVLVTGANGQLGRALKEVFPEAEFTTRQDFDLADDFESTKRWKDYSIIINAAAYTKVDEAETESGKKTAWKINAEAVAKLSKIASQNQITLVQVSSDYVFDGQTDEHSEDEELSPLGVYGQTKAAGDIAAKMTPKHYIVRTSWVVGDGNNFVKTMKTLAEKGVKPSVVDDQIGRLSFTKDIAEGIKHLLDTNAPYGTYNLSNAGKSVSWCEIAKKVYELSEKSADDVSPVSTEKYYEGKEFISPRPLKSTLNITKIEQTGFQPRDWEEALEDYISKI